MLERNKYVDFVASECVRQRQTTHLHVSKRAWLSQICRFSHADWTHTQGRFLGRFTKRTETKHQGPIQVFKLTVCNNYTTKHFTKFQSYTRNNKAYLICFLIYFLFYFYFFIFFLEMFLFLFRNIISSLSFSLLCVCLSVSHTYIRIVFFYFSM